MSYRLQTSCMPGAWMIFACLLWFGAISLHGATRYVVPPGTPGVIPTSGYTTWATAATNIQTAINVTPDQGDTVWVTNGTYYLKGEISIGVVTLRSVNGMEKTFINGNFPAYSNRCLNIWHANSVVTGFTIMNAYGPGYSAGNAGGGVLMGVGTIRNCHITTNKGDWGSGIHITGAGRAYDCIISSNRGTGAGGGMCISGENSIISNCVFLANYTADRGGGLNIYGENQANRAATVMNCTFISNNGQYGAGALPGGANNIIRNCLFVGNFGIGVSTLYAKDNKIQNCTFVRNTSAGLERYDWDGNFGALVENCIIVSNAYSSTARTTNINNRTDSIITLGVNAGNITNNPSFVNYASGNFRLANNSPCINTGSNETWMTKEVDLDGKMRIRYGRVDMGAYERIHEATFYRFR